MKRFSVYSLIVISAFNNILLCTTPFIPVEVQHLYNAAQRGDASLVEKNLEWHREHDKKKPVAMLEQARDMAVAHNDAKAAVFLTTRLKQEQMGSWEKYFRGITLVATIAAVTGIVVSFNAVLKERQQQQQPRAARARSRRQSNAEPQSAPIDRQQGREFSHQEAQDIMLRRTPSPQLTQDSESTDSE